MKSLSSIKSRRRMLGVLLTVGCLILSLVGPVRAQDPADGAAAAAETGWRWEKLAIPRVLVIEGFWAEQFRWEQALHQAGCDYQQAYRSRSPYRGQHDQIVDLPRDDAAWQRFSTVLLINVDAQALGKETLERMRRFVAAGGGLVVMGGYWSYSRGAYAGTPLEEMLPVQFPQENRIPPHYPGLTLSRPAQAQWKLPLDFAAAPRAYFVQNLQAKPGASVELGAGGQPAVIAGAFAGGRVVASALTANGAPPQGELAFWDWPQWQLLLGQMVHWSAAGRPLAGAATAAALPLTSAEVDALTMDGGTLSPAMIQRIMAHPSKEIAHALQQRFTAGEGPKAALPLPLAHAMARFAQPDWEKPLLEVLERMSPDGQRTEVACLLLGAVGGEAARTALQGALSREDSRQGALIGLSYLGDPQTIVPLERALQEARKACRNFEDPSQEDPQLLADKPGAAAVYAQVALYRSGQKGGLQRVLDAHRQTRLLRRIFANAAKRRVADTDLQGQSLRRVIVEHAQRLRQSEVFLLSRAGPVPASQIQDFLLIAKDATDVDDVRFLAAALEQSLGNPAMPWQELTQAKDGILAALARAGSASTASPASPVPLKDQP